MGGMGVWLGGHGAHEHMRVRGHGGFCGHGRRGMGCRGIALWGYEMHRHPRLPPRNTPTYQTRILESGKMGEMEKMEENGGAMAGKGEK